MIVLRCFALIFAMLTPLVGLADIVPRMLLLGAAATAKGIVAVGERGTVLFSTDSGTTWQPVTSPSRATLTAVAFAPDGLHGWAVGHDDIIIATADGGRTWTIDYQGKNLENSLLDVCVSDDQIIIAVGAYGHCVESHDAGATWVARNLQDDDSHLNRITAGPGGTLYIAGERGTLLRSTNRGESWIGIPSDYEGSFYGILPINAERLIAHGLRGRIYRSENNGDEWMHLPLDKTPLLSASCLLRSGIIVLAGQSRAFYVSRDEGLTFTAWELPLTLGIAKLLETPDGHLLAFGEGGVHRLPSP